MTNPVLLSRFTPSLMAPETLERILVQRHDLAADLVESIQESVLTPAKHFRLLIGPRGIGKTHMITLVYYRIKAAIQANATLGQRLWIAWLREEEWGIASFLDLLLRIFRALEAEYPQEYQAKLRAGVAQLYRLSPQEAEFQAQKLLREFVGERTLLILAENLGDLFEGLGDSGQKQFRAYIQNYNFITILATAQSLFAGVSDREAPFYGSFRVDYLEPFNLDEVMLMLEQIAQLFEEQELVAYLKTSAGQARVRAVHHLAGGNPRVYVIFAQFLTRESLDALVGAFMETLDDLTPYYQSRMAWISPQQRKIVEFLVEVRRPATVKEIAQQCFITHQTTSSQLKDLLEKGYVRVDTVGRESFYELREPLMRFCLEVKKQRGEPVRLFVDFLRIWYDRSELEQRHAELTAQCFPETKLSLELIYLSHALNQTETQTDDPRVAAYWDELKRLQEEENWSEALKITEKLIKLRGNAEDWFQKGCCLFFQKRYEESLEAVDKAIDINPKEVSFWLLRGLSLGFLGRPEEELLAYNHENLLEPKNNKIVLCGLGVMLMSMKRHEEALENFDLAIAIAPDDAILWLERGMTLLLLNHHEEALESFDQAIALNPKYRKAWFYRGIVLGRTNCYEAALESFEQATALGLNNGEIWKCRGSILLLLNRHEEALESFSLAIKLNPDDVFTWISLGYSLLCQGRREEAMENYQQAFNIALRSNDSERQEQFGFLALQLTNAIPILVDEKTSLKTAQTVLETWGKLAGEYSEFQVALRLLATAVQYKEAKDDKQRRRVLLGLPQEERRVLEPLLKLETPSSPQL